MFVHMLCTNVWKVLRNLVCATLLLSSSSVEYNTLSQIMSIKLGQSWFRTYVQLLYMASSI